MWAHMSFDGWPKIENTQDRSLTQNVTDLQVNLEYSWVQLGIHLELYMDYLQALILFVKPVSIIFVH